MKLNTVKKLYAELNARNFGGVLETPRIHFSRTRLCDAFYWHNGLGLNLETVKGFDAVRELLFHEMCHQYVHEFLGLETVPDHGRDFKKTYNKFHTLDFDFDFDYEV